MENREQILLFFWEKLVNVTTVALHTTTGWTGSGTVRVLREDSTLIFHEQGSWQTQELSFNNRLYWVLDPRLEKISLGHLRRGTDQFLVHLTPVDAHALTSINSHLCGKDSYFCQLRCHSQGLCLNWRVAGSKNEELNYFYT